MIKHYALPAILAGASFLAVPAATAQEDFESPKQAGLSYAVKFVCSEANEDVGTGLLPGVYATAINVHNPSLEQSAIYFKKFVQGFVKQEQGPPSEFERNEIKPNHAFEVECREILARLPQPNPRTATGFVVFLTQRPLDITAVYTAGPLSQQEVASIHVEPIAPRRLGPGGDGEQRADLTVREITRPTGECPDGPGSCVFQSNVTIANIGSADAGPFDGVTVFDPQQSVVVPQAFGGLAAGDVQTFTVTTPRMDNCFDPDCTVCAVVDTLNAITESSETNNKLCKTFAG
jgi:hypothetical protein